ncbi:MAG: hypothetical protein ACKVTZ_04100 [Bacteroidia bacterium]
MENKPSFQTQLQQDVKENAALPTDAFLSQMLATQKHLFEKASKEVTFSPPLLKWNETGVFRKGTINVIQGKFGCHKSRLAELFCSVFLKTKECETPFLGFNSSEETQFAVSYIDTERNLDEEIPATIQNIREKAGFERTELNPHFYVTSIKKFERKERLNAVKSWVLHLKKEETKQLFAVLDVVTDCVESFNSDGQSMELFDFLGNLCDECGVTFLLLIHENPGTEKARGHTGTEAANKSSCVMQISIESEAENLIKLKFIKLRAAARPEPIYLQYCSTAKGLVMASSSVVESVVGSKRKKADIELVKERLEILLYKPMPQKELCSELIAYFGGSENTIKNRLKVLADTKAVFLNAEGQECLLVMEWEKGKSAYYYLKPNLPTLPGLEIEG